MPESDEFEDLRDWYAPLLEQGADDIRGEIQSEEACVWEPVGTPEEYLRVNLTPPRLSYMSSEEIFRSGEAECRPGLVLGSGATLGDGVRLEQAVVWENERVPDHLIASQGVFAGGQFYEFPLDSRNER
jgi:NDP-sugar pyrophosphorylase family protein